MEDKCYRRLAQHLDRLPEGLAPSETGAELRLLQQLFTPQEADLAIYLTLDRCPAATIAAHAHLPLSEAEPLLETMARKGLIMSAQAADGSLLYQAVPFIIGIYEFQVNNTDPKFWAALQEYWGSVRPRLKVQTIPQVRTIPVGQAIAPQIKALPYEQVEELIQAHDRFAVAPCICRHRARLLGKGCDSPQETCMFFGDWADYYVRTGRGRRIDRHELHEILARANAANLVLQPSNARDIAFLCCCCGCCCGVLGDLKRHPHPAEMVASSFIARLDPDLCQDCRTCLGRCQMGALAVDGDRVVHNPDRCIGCGLCVSTCPGGALALVRKVSSRQAEVPADMAANWREIQRVQTGGR